MDAGPSPPLRDGARHPLPAIAPPTPQLGEITRSARDHPVVACEWV